MNEINFSDIEKNIMKRENEIKNIRLELAPLISVNEVMQVIIEPSLEPEARAIMQRINTLKTKNERDKVFYESAVALLKKHKLLNSMERVDLGQAVGWLRRDISRETEQLKNKFLAGAIDNELYSKNLESILAPLKTRIAEIEGVSKELFELEKEREK